MPTLSPALLLALLEGQGLGVEYQPIVEVASGNIIGHEALARFRGADGRNLPPERVFCALHDSPLSLFQLELKIKKLQILQAPESGLLFLNIDQDAFATFLDEACHPLVELLAGHPRAVVEIIENSSISDAQVSIAMLGRFGSAGIPMALDDIGARDSLVSLDVLARVDYLKLARDWLNRLSGPHDRPLLHSLLDFARQSGKAVVLEGVETAEHLQLARRLGIGLVQGYLFRPRFVQVWAPPAHRQEQAGALA
ncbi:EAL domain-containing protein [Azotobacter vinelandii]|uniref:EAL domain-containing protein n=1 Tax=Azotobacter TaxID=352 RepID=UPI000045A43C|nr:EAL domain-containing protein [Azotobacter vinelandii]WKN20504.1 EAL domain-containing protein [Azotobacter vinelandii]GLK57971.1 diguanylate phosphodiesterase [Azotobacter vinelandii]SFX24585.1 EAL domain, c-di-GMP-specific phosphodiesterase class I (or its enzymatically inactive variant) [Azotobacter vinelandii]